MTHLTDAQLNEYVDGTLPPAEHDTVSQHVATCAACQTQLAELQHLFATLTAVTDQPLAIDLNERIMAQMETLPTTAVPHLNRWAFLLLLGQLLGALLVLMLLWPTLTTLWQVGFETSQEAWTTIQWPTVTIELSLTEWWENLTQARQSPNFDLAANQWLYLLGFTLIAWLIGNTLLLKPTHQLRRE